MGFWRFCDDCVCWCALPFGSDVDDLLMEMEQYKVLALGFVSLILLVSPLWLVSANMEGMFLCVCVLYYQLLFCYFLVSFILHQKLTEFIFFLSICLKWLLNLEMTLFFFTHFLFHVCFDGWNFLIILKDCYWR